MSITETSPSRRYRRAIAGTVAAVALGALIAGCGSSNSAATSATAAPARAGAQQPPPGLGTPVAGAAADKAKAAALAKYPGTVERVMRLSDGSYVVHVIQSSGGEVHVKVSKTFEVTGTEQGPPPGAPSSANGPATQS